MKTIFIFSILASLALSSCGKEEASFSPKPATGELRKTRTDLQRKLPPPKADESRAIFVGYQTHTFNRGACDDDWNSARKGLEERGRTILAGFRSHGSCTRTVFDPKYDTGFDVSGYGEGNPIESRKAINAIQGMEFSGKLIQYAYDARLIDEVTMNFQIMAYKSSSSQMRQTSILGWKSFRLESENDAYLDSFIPPDHVGFNFIGLAQDLNREKVEEVQKFIDAAKREGFTINLLSEKFAFLEGDTGAIPLWTSYRSWGRKPLETRLIRTANY